MVGSGAVALYALPMAAGALVIFGAGFGGLLQRGGGEAVADALHKLAAAVCGFDADSGKGIVQHGGIFCHICGGSGFFAAGVGGGGVVVLLAGGGSMFRGGRAGKGGYKGALALSQNGGGLHSFKAFCGALGFCKRVIAAEISGNIAALVQRVDAGIWGNRYPVSDAIPSGRGFAVAKFHGIETFRSAATFDGLRLFDCWPGRAVFGYPCGNVCGAGGACFGGRAVQRVGAGGGIDGAACRIGAGSPNVGTERGAVVGVRRAEDASGGGGTLGGAVCPAGAAQRQHWRGAGGQFAEGEKRGLYEVGAVGIGAGKLSGQNVGGGALSLCLGSMGGGFSAGLGALGVRGADTVRNGG